jgi:beta-glucuronidase
VCRRQLRGLIARDKNHPSVIMWSVANEPLPPKMLENMLSGRPEPLDPAGGVFLKALIDMAHDLDPTRPATLVGAMGRVAGAGRHRVCEPLWGWYLQPGQPEQGAEILDEELDNLYEVFGKPVIVTEFGADTVAGRHSEPPRMWTEEYQVEFLRSYLDVADRKPFVVGMHVWNFADFQACSGAARGRHESEGSSPATGGPRWRLTCCASAGPHCPPSWMRRARRLSS